MNELSILEIMQDMEKDILALRLAMDIDHNTKPYNHTVELSPKKTHKKLANIVEKAYEFLYENE